MESRPRVLIVDDELGVRESLRAILQSECDVLTAGSGDQALEMIEHESVDLMTLDLKMPGLGGMGVLERAKQIDPDIEVLIITGYGSFDTAVEGLRFRAFDYLAKPFDCDQVRELVHKAYEHRLAARRVKSVPEQLLSTLSHQMRTPLNAIVGYSSMLQDEGKEALSDDQRFALDRIQSNSANFLGYVETLFFLADLNRGLHPMTVAPVRIASVVTQVAHELRGLAAAKGLAIRGEAPDDLVVHTDEDKLLRLVRALADNAVKFSGTGEVVLAATTAADGSALLEVRDVGPGMAPELVAEMRAETTDPTPHVPRTLGFGLRLVAALGRLLSIGIDVAALPSGTTWRLRVPSLVESAPHVNGRPAPA
jgi:signal transduction histidine kinase